MLLEVKDISKCLPDGRGGTNPVLDRVTLHIDTGEAVGLLGESGCGKTTLARIIAGLENADSGRIAFDGVVRAFPLKRRDLTREIRQSLRSIQMVFQNPAASFVDSMTIRTAVAEGVRYKPTVSRADVARLTADALEAVGLPSLYWERRAFELSGGQCQRAALARAIVSSPRLIICDEATSALDVTTQAQILRLLGDIQRNRGVAFLLITHNRALAASFCHRIYGL